MFGAALITGIGVFLILKLQGNGFRGLEVFIGGCAGVIALCYVVETVLRDLIGGRSRAVPSPSRTGTTRSSAYGGVYATVFLARPPSMRVLAQAQDADVLLK